MTASPGYSVGQTSLSGKVMDQQGEPVIFAAVALYQSGVLKKGMDTDFDGNYVFSSIDPGTYDLEVSYVGLTTKRIEGVVVFAGRANKLNVELSSDPITLTEVVCYAVPLVEQDNTTSGGIITSEQIKKLPRRNVNSMAANTAGLAAAKEGETVVVRGSRGNPTDYYVDGVRVTGSSVPQVEEAPNSESYAPIQENQFIETKKEHFSTFSIDVDGAAYSNTRRYLNRRQLPPPDAVRTEELVNYFDYGYDLPEDGHPFSVYTELSACPWEEGHQLLHIGLKGTEADPTTAPPANLVFLVDVSGSMKDHNKLPLLKRAFGLLVDQLRPQDRVSLLTYSGSFDVVLEPTPGTERTTIRSAMDGLVGGGGTAGGAALQKAYELAGQYFNPDGSNRIILATDGDFNVGISSPAELEEFIANKRETGVYLSVLGFGTGNYKDDRLETLANKGNGNYAYIDDLEEAEKIFVTELAGTLFTIAKDVKLQVEFDETTVEQYRLIGYENRILAKEDFENDTKDAGELGAGHTVTALYQIVPRSGATNKELATVHLRYKRPKEEQSSYMAKAVPAQALPLESTSEAFRFSAAVAAFALCLRDSVHKGSSSFQMAKSLADGARQYDLEDRKLGFVELVEQADKIVNAKSEEHAED